MNKPLISICIPTYNRALFLRECLDSIARQFSDEEVKNKVNVFILDNQSEDDTEEVARKFTDVFENVKYVKDDQNRKIAPGIVKAASLADGEYIWIFSDDDLYLNNSLKIIIEAIEATKADLVINNLNVFFGNLKKTTINLLGISQDYFITNRKDFFIYLNKKVFKNIDFYTTFCSNWILKREILENYSYILDKFNGPLDVFPFHSIVFYSGAQIDIKIISTPILFMRGDNESWGSKDKIKHYFYRNKLWKYHYKNILDLNKKDIPPLFSFKVKIKNFLEIRGLLDYLLVIFLKKIYLYKFIKFIYWRLKFLKSNLNRK
jgi:abequosyltransferase